jgi:hypothetical protein
MNRFSNFIASVIHNVKSHNRSMRKESVSHRARLSLENMDERCMPSVSPLTLGSTHEVIYNPFIVSHDAELSKMEVKVALSSTLQEGRKH